MTSNASNFVALLRARARQQPDREAYSFLVGGERDALRLTHADLDRQARAIGALLHQSGARGKIVLLLYPPGLEFVAAFFGCLYGGAAAVPLYPPHPARLSRFMPSLLAVARDARPHAALVSSRILATIEGACAEVPELLALRWLATDELAGELASEWEDPAVDGDTLALLQYTSGSTAAPKGVLIRHGNLIHSSALIQHCFEHTPESRGVIWLPPYHDMGLIGGVLQPLYADFPVTLMSPLAFLQRPLRWLEAISRTRATTSGGPNFAYDLCVRKLTPGQAATLDLSSWDVAFNGAERVQDVTLERFASAFAPCGFRREAWLPCYGLAEATLIVSGGAKKSPPIVRAFERGPLGANQALAAPEGADSALRLVGCGQALPGHQIVIVDPASRTRCPPGRVGEIWVAGPSVALGYWNQADETRQNFCACLADTGEGPFLRTGDLGFLHLGELFVTGRLKDLIVIDGRNVHPQDIELTVEQSHPAVQPGGSAAFSVDLAGQEQLVILAEVARGRAAPLREPPAPEDQVLVRSIRRAVAEHHDLQARTVLLLKPGGLPKTSSGKLQRQFCRSGFLAGTLGGLEAEE